MDDNGDHRRTYNAPVLGTALMRVLNSNRPTEDRWKRCNMLRGLCDPGSKINLITTAAVNRLGLERISTNIQLISIGDRRDIAADSRVTVRIGPCLCGSDFLEAQFVVVDVVSADMPAHPIRTNWLGKGFRNKILADPAFHTVGPVEALLGVGIWAAIVRPQIRYVEENMVVQQTRLGWVVFGSLSSHVDSHYEDDRTDNAQRMSPETAFEAMHVLRTSWELDGHPMKHSCAPTGEGHPIHDERRQRYAPKIACAFDFTWSMEHAKELFHALEQRMLENSELRCQYVEFMRENIEHGHLSLSNGNAEAYHVPHHCLIVPRKFRSLFAAPHPIQGGLTIYAIQLIGEKLDDNLPSLLRHFRSHCVALKATMKKLATPPTKEAQRCNDKGLQKVFWRESPDDQLLVYDLKTAANDQTSQHCTVRALHEYAFDHKVVGPLGAYSIFNCIQMDEYFDGAPTKGEATAMRKQLSNISKHCSDLFEFTQWCSNLPDGDSIAEAVPIVNDSMLRLRWMPAGDYFTFSVRPTITATAAATTITTTTTTTTDSPQMEVWTKRQIVTEIGKLYDPCGLVAPMIMQAKLLLRDIWRDEHDVSQPDFWDRPIPCGDETHAKWNELVANLSKLNEIRVPRWLGTTRCRQVYLTGFCIANESAYVAAVYVRVPISANGIAKNTCQLLQAKTRIVSPQRKFTSLRMELLAAKLLAGLMSTLMKSFTYSIQSEINYSNSRVVVKLIEQPPKVLKPMTARLVSAIQKVSHRYSWCYVHPSYNPANLGLQPVDRFLQDLRFWYNGPKFLRLNVTRWEDMGVQPRNNPNPAEVKVIRSAMTHPKLLNIRCTNTAEIERNDRLVQQTIEASQRKARTNDILSCTNVDGIFDEDYDDDDDDDDDDDNGSGHVNVANQTVTTNEIVPCATVNTLTAEEMPGTGTANSKAARDDLDLSYLINSYGNIDTLIDAIGYKILIKSGRVIRPLLADERERALRTAIRWEQNKYIPETMASLVAGQSIRFERPYRIMKLTLHGDGLAYVNGTIDDSSKQPLILLPNGSMLARRLFEHVHRQLEHGGAKRMLNDIFKKYWMALARRLAEQVIQSCEVCSMRRSAFANRERCTVNMQRKLHLTRTIAPFSRVSIDCCGPVQIKTKQGFETTLVDDAYVCFFICLDSKAVHIELVSKMTTSGFIAALRRLVARRGIVHEIVCSQQRDSNFAALHEHLQTLGSYPFKEEFGLDWYFRPKHAAANDVFGRDVFERIIQSAQQQLICVMGLWTLTFEEHTNFLAQVEGVLNSRPICQLTDEPADMEPLTPAYLLTGRSIVLPIMDKGFHDISPTYPDPSTVPQILLQRFWRRWTDDYFNALHVCTKPRTGNPNFGIGEMVILKEHCSPTHWCVGRIVDVPAESKAAANEEPVQILLRIGSGATRRSIHELHLLERTLPIWNDLISVNNINSDYESSLNLSDIEHSDASSD